VLFLCCHAAIGLVVQLITHSDEVLGPMSMMCTREFFHNGEGFHVEEEKEFIMNWFIKRESHVAGCREMVNTCWDTIFGVVACMQCLPPEAIRESPKFSDSGIQKEFVVVLLERFGYFRWFRCNRQQKMQPATKPLSRSSTVVWVEPRLNGRWLNDPLSAIIS